VRVLDASAPPAEVAGAAVRALDDLLPSAA
jgi:hypothetical protein